MPVYNPPTAILITGNTYGAPQLISGSIYLSGGDNISIGQTAQTIEISAAAGGGTGADGLNRISAGTQIAATLATVVFSNSNNITFGMTNNSIITASFNQTVESQSLGMSNLGNTSGTTGIASGGQVRFLFAGGNNVTLSQSINGASGTITISAFNSVAPTGISSIVGSDATYTSGSVQFTGSNIVTVKSSANQRIVIDASQSVQTQNRFNLTLDGNTAGVLAQVSSGTLTLAGGNNIVLSQNGNAITISGSAFPAQTNQILGLYAVGNTTGESSSSTFDARTISYKGLGIASVGYSGGTILISVPSGGGAGDGVNILAAGTQTANTTGTVLFDNANGITFGMNNSSVITASHSVPVVSNGILDVNTATGSGTATSRFAAHDHVHRGVAGVDVNGIASTFYGTVQLSAGNLISIATGGNSTRGSMQIIDLLSSATTVSSVGSANNVGAMASRFALEGHIHGGVGAIGVSNDGAGDTGSKHGTWWLSENGNVSLSVQTSNNGSNTIYISAGGGGGNFSAGLSTGGNTSGSTGMLSERLVMVFTNGVYASQSTNGGSGTLVVSLSGKPPYTGNMNYEVAQSRVLSFHNIDRSIVFVPFVYEYPEAYTAKTVRFWASRAGGATLLATVGFALYSYSHTSRLDLVASSTQAYSLASSTYWSGVRAYEFTGFSSTSLTSGSYAAAMWYSSNGGNASFVVLGAPAISAASWVGTVYNGNNSTANAGNTDKIVPFLGVHSFSTASFPSSVAASDIYGAGATANSNGPYLVQFLEV